MIIDCPKNLKLFRGPGLCEYCEQWFDVRDAAHLFAKGQGGGKQIDLPINLCSLCWKCHRIGNHNGKEPTFGTLVKIIAQREGVTPEWVIAEVYRIRRLPKESEYVESPRPVLTTRRPVDDRANLGIGEDGPHCVSGGTPSSGQSGGRSNNPTSPPTGWAEL